MACLSPFLCRCIFFDSRADHLHFLLHDFTDEGVVGFGSMRSVRKYVWLLSVHSTVILPPQSGRVSCQK